jgi:hypothetical protein
MFHALLSRRRGPRQRAHKVTFAPVALQCERFGAAMRVLSRTIVCSALLLAVAGAHAQWKWRDASGRIHLSDLPPPTSVPDKDILQRPTPRKTAEIPPARAQATAAAASAAPLAAAAASAAARKTPLDLELERKRKAEEADRLAKSKADEERRAALRQENCSRARSTVATLDSGQRITRVNDKGEREFLDDRQRAEEARRAREIMASDCR